MLRYMLDTDICSNVIRTHSPTLRDKFNAHQEEMCVSSIALGELYFGAERSDGVRRRRLFDAIQNLGARLVTLPFGEEAAAHYGQIRSELERAGKMIGSNDMLIAAHARSQGLIVVTNNGREFERVQGLRVENWMAERG